jgi:hypothetical protein
MLATFAKGQKAIASSSTSNGSLLHIFCTSFKWGEEKQGTFEACK